MRSGILRTAFLVLVLWATGKPLLAEASSALVSKATPRAAGTVPCPVCTTLGDGTCVEVKVTKATPRAKHGGRTYCFCSQACRRLFVRNPGKYLSDRGR